MIYLRKKIDQACNLAEASTFEHNPFKGQRSSMPKATISVTPFDLCKTK